MKPFDLERALAGDPVRTYGGNRVDEIYCFETGAFPLKVRFGNIVMDYDIYGNIDSPINVYTKQLYMDERDRVAYVELPKVNSHFSVKPKIIMGDSRLDDSFIYNTCKHSVVIKIEWDEDSDEVKSTRIV